MFKKAKTKAQQVAAAMPVGGVPNLHDIKNIDLSNKGEARRIALWVFWTMNTLVDIIYIGMTFATSTRLAGVEVEIKGFNAHIWGAPIAAAALGGIMVLIFNVISCVVLMRKSINRSGPGFGYGFIMAWCFIMTFYLLLCGLVLDAFTDTIESDVQEKGDMRWGGYYTQIYKATVIFAYICSAMFLIFFVCLVVFQGGISKTMGLYDANTDRKRQMELAAVARAAQANVTL